MRLALAALFTLIAVAAGIYFVKAPLSAEATLLVIGILMFSTIFAITNLLTWLDRPRK